MKICYSPYNEKAMDQNKYIFQVIQSINKAGFEVVSVRDTLRNLKTFNDVKVFNLNWYENIYDSNKVRAYIHFLSKYFFIYFLKLFGKRIVWTMHNKVPHDSNNEFLSKKLMTHLINSADAIITHCKDTNEEILKLTNKPTALKKVIQINHPNYSGLYNKPDRDIRKEYNINENDTVFLFFGQIKPYKNIELIIKVAEQFKGENIKFIIAGKCVNEEYEKDLDNLINDNENIIKIFRFIKNEEIPNIMDACNALLLPYDINSSLNSGSAILAFTLGKTVICPQIGTLNQVNSYNDLFSYTYKNEKEHIESIVRCIEEILSYPSPIDYLSEKGSNLKEIIEKENSVDKISKKYKLLFNQLL